MKIHHENFDIEIITCSERSVGKLKITPRKRSSLLRKLLQYTEKQKNRKISLQKPIDLPELGLEKSP